MSSITNDPFFPIFCDFLISATRTDSERPALLLSGSLNIAFLRKIQSAKPSDCAALLQKYGRVLQTDSPVHKLQVAESGVYPFLIGFLGHENPEVVHAAAGAVWSLTVNRCGEDYGRFVEERLFEELMKYLPPGWPDPVTVELVFSPDGQCESEPFDAVGWTWSAFYCYSVCGLARSLVIVGP
jgi:hypothetical protein